MAGISTYTEPGNMGFQIYFRNSLSRWSFLVIKQSTLNFTSSNDDKFTN